MATPRWDVFLVLAGIAVGLFLALARLSAKPVRDSQRQHRQDRSTVTVTPAGIDPAATGLTSTVAIHEERASLGDLSPAMLLANVALTQGLFGGLVLGAAVAFAIPASALGAGDLFGDAVGLPMVGGVALGLSLWLLSEGASTVVDAAGIDHDESLRGLLAPDSARGWVVLLGVVLPLIAGVEELLFRAAMIGAVHAGTGVSPWTMAVMSSVAFGVGHSAQGRAGVVLTGVVGFVLAAAFVVTGSFLTVFLAHYVLNATEFLVHEA